MKCTVATPQPKPASVRWAVTRRQGRPRFAGASMKCAVAPCGRLCRLTPESDVRPSHARFDGPPSQSGWPISLEAGGKTPCVPLSARPQPSPKSVRPTSPRTSSFRTHRVTSNFPKLAFSRPWCRGGLRHALRRNALRRPQRVTPPSTARCDCAPQRRALAREKAPVRRARFDRLSGLTWRFPLWWSFTVGS